MAIQRGVNFRTHQIKILTEPLYIAQTELIPLDDLQVLPQVQTLAVDNLNNALNYYEDLHKKNSLS